MLQFDNVDFHYPNGTKVLKKFSFSLTKGSSLGILGESGSGKSTVAKLACALYLPCSGTIIKQGKLQMIFQNPTGSLNPRWTIREILQEPLKLHGIDRCPKQMLEEMSLPADLLDRTPLNLSGGQCQRIAIARALSLKPDFIVADESTSSLDCDAEAQILSLLKEKQRQEGFGLIIISHNPEVIRKTTDQLIVLRNGTIVEAGATECIFKAPANPYTQLLLSSAF